jgi:hypothetical protein
VTWWRRDEPPGPQSEERLASWTAGRRRAVEAVEAVEAPPPPSAEPEDGDVETLVSRVLGEVDGDYTPGQRPVLSPEPGGPTPERHGAEGAFHVEPDEDTADAADLHREGPERPSTAAEGLAWRWRRGQRDPRSVAVVPSDEHQAVTVRRVAPPGAAGGGHREGSTAAPRPRPAPPGPPVRVESAPREELERARARATGAWQQPPDDVDAWARVAELRHP